MHEDAIQAIEAKIFVLDSNLKIANSTHEMEEASRLTELIRRLNQSKMVLFIDSKSREGK